ncbi:methionine--tRNA ligase [candidate division KSB1 bacterium]|nr:methionine--tRNA ligase [candidate division KSB1 bacterium]
MKTYKRILVTSALPYANGPIHLGHLAGAYLPADIFVRYQRMKKREVVYICGSDEHGVPITIAAEKQKKSPQDIVDYFHFRNKTAFQRFGISFDYYGRTSSTMHHETSRAFFRQLESTGVFRKKTEKQLFDQKAGMFLPDRYVCGVCPVCQNDSAYGDQCEKCGSSLSATDLQHPKSVLTGETPVLRETTHWYLPLGDWQEKLQKWFDEKKHWKTNVVGQVKSWLQAGLNDRAVTRDLSWGVPVPLEEASGKVLYVWFDAPIGYISATKEWAAEIGKPDLWQKYWQDADTRLIHFIGKDNIVFHCIMFPAMLMAHGGYVLPDNVPANEFLNLEGEKLSTSRNYAVWLEDYLQRFAPDPLRYYLAVNAPETKDADFTWKEYQQRNNGELADILGNLINRTLTFTAKYFNNQVPPRSDLDPMDQEMIQLLNQAPGQIGDLIDKVEIRKATAAVIDVARAANKYFNDQEPWRTIRSDSKKCGTTLHICLQTLRALAILMEPILPFSAQKLYQILGYTDTIQTEKWDDAGDCLLPAGRKLGRAEILFRKIEDQEIESEITRLKRAGNAQTIDQKAEEPKINQIPIEEFAKIELRVAQVVSAEKVEQADKLLKLLVKVGDQERQIVAGIARHYSPQDLVGKQVVVVANLQPATIRGIESNGMLLAAQDESGKLSIVTLEQPLENGARVR